MNKIGDIIKNSNTFSEDGSFHPENFPLKELWEENPYVAISILLGYFGDLPSNIANLLYTSLTLNVISAQTLGVLGLDESEVRSMVDARIKSNSNQNLDMELLVIAAVREYDAQIKEIMKEEKINDKHYDEFRKTLANFSLENSITDLKSAFKFLKSTKPEEVNKFND